MYWTYPNKKVTVDVEFLAHEKELLTVSRTIQPDGIEADDNGQKWAKKGSFIDKDGKVTVPNVTATNVTFTNPPIGILFSSVKVTEGPDAGAVMIKGWVKGDYMDWGDYEWNPKYGEAIHKILPDINFKDNMGTIIYGPMNAPINNPGVTPEEPSDEDEGFGDEDMTTKATIEGDMNNGFTVTYENLGLKKPVIKVVKKTGGTEMERSTYWTMVGSNPYTVKIKSTIPDDTYTLQALTDKDKEPLQTQDFTKGGD